MPYLVRGARPWCSTTHTPSSLPPNPLVSAHSLHAHNTTPHTTPAIATTALASHGGGTLRQAASRSARMPSGRWRARLPRIPAKGGKEKRRSRKRHSHRSAARSCPQRDSWTRDDGNREGAQSRSMMPMWKQHRHIRQSSALVHAHGWFRSIEGGEKWWDGENRRFGKTLLQSADSERHLLCTATRYTPSSLLGEKPRQRDDPPESNPFFLQPCSPFQDESIHTPPSSSAQ